MKTFFKELFEYSHHVNQQIGAVFVSQPEKTSERANVLYCHLLNAHQIWNNRIMPVDPLFGVWALHAVDKYMEMDTRNYKQTLAILDKFNLAQVLDYTNSKGQKFTNSIRDILFHAINHSTYHRGQIATEFRNNGIEPIITDYIFYKR